MGTDPSALEHSGFGRGGAWDPPYEFFVRGWSDILFRLESQAPLS